MELRPSSSHTDRIAGSLRSFPAHPPVRQIVQVSRLSASPSGFSGGLPPAGLMAECTAEHRSGARVNIAGRMPQEHRGSVVSDAQSLCSPGSDIGELKRCGLAQFNPLGPEASANHFAAPVRPIIIDRNRSEVTHLRWRCPSRTLREFPVSVREFRVGLAKCPGSRQKVPVSISQGITT